MKRLIITIILIASIGINEKTFAKNNNALVPQSVQMAFAAKYPQTKFKGWKVSGDTYIAAFVLNHRSYHAYFLSNGSWLSTNRNVKHMATLPVNARLFLKKGEYASWHVDGLEKMQTPSQTEYMVEIDNHSGTPSSYEGGGSASSMSLYFDNAGQLVKAD